MRAISWDELLQQFDPCVHDALQGLTSKPGTEFLVVFQNQNFDASGFGATSAVAVGPGHTYRSLQDAYATWLGDLPSQRQHPVAHAVAPSPTA